MTTKRKVIWTHLQDAHDQDRTVCGLVIWEAIRVTENEGQVTCPDCTKENCAESMIGRSVGVAIAA